MPGVEVRLQADPSNQVGESNEADNRLVLKPVVGRGSVLPLTLVPVLQPGETTPPTLPSTDLILDMLPLREVHTVTRPPFSHGAIVGNSSKDWGILLGALLNLRVSDGSNRYYYGVVRTGYGGGIAGIAHYGYPVSVGWDKGGSAALVMVHEIGHNLRRGHAPCNVEGEQGYPYQGGHIGTWGYSVSRTLLFNPSRYKDVMGYCSPKWISDYTYAGIQNFVETSLPVVKPQSQSAAQDVLLFSGRILGGQIELNPITQLHAVPEPPEPGLYRLRMATEGGTVDVSFRTYPVEAPHGPDQPPGEAWSEEHFAFSLPNPGPVQSLEITHAGRRLFQRLAEPRVQSQVAPKVDLLEQSGRITLSWDHHTYPYAALAHLGSQRTTLGLWLRGGGATLSTQGLEAGGKLEVSLSDGLNSVRQEFWR